MSESAVRDLSSLSQMSRSELQDLWQKLFQASPPTRLHKQLMSQIIGYRMQEQQYGGLTVGSRRRLRKIARLLEKDRKADISGPLPIKPGTRLVRQWRGQTHAVTVEEKGFEYKGLRYQSLSEIARLITGTRWSGPLFFGLKRSEPQSGVEPR